MNAIHQSAIIHDGAEIGEDVTIGPYSVIGGNVRIGKGTEIHTHVVIDGTTSIGEECRIYPFAAIGLPPQDLKYAGEDNSLNIGSRTRIREYVTMNPGTKGGGSVTTIGDDCLFMAGAHVAHDCQIGNHVIFANNATIGGHCIISDFAILGGLSAVHQFVRIGRHAFVGGMSGVEADIIPFGSVMGNRAYLRGLNVVGMKRHGFSRKVIHELRTAYRLLFSDEGTLKERIRDAHSIFADNEQVKEILEFLSDNSGRSFCMPKQISGHAV